MDQTHFDSRIKSSKCEISGSGLAAGEPHEPPRVPRCELERLASILTDVTCKSVQVAACVKRHRGISLRSLETCVGFCESEPASHSALSYFDSALCPRPRTAEKSFHRWNGYYRRNRALHVSSSSSSGSRCSFSASTRYQTSVFNDNLAHPVRAKCVICASSIYANCVSRSVFNRARNPRL